MTRTLLLLLAIVLAGCASGDLPPVASPEPLPPAATPEPLPSASPTPAATPTSTTPAATPAPTSRTPVSPAPTPPVVVGPPVRLVPHLQGFSSPLLLTHDGEAGVVYVVEQGGVVWRVAGEARSKWLDLSADTRGGGERGLLGLAFEPAGDRTYASYTNLGGDSVLERVHADGSREKLLEVAQPYPNHNGGHLAFGPDGYLYWGLGDGGSANDPEGNGQDARALLGSLLRLDVSGARGYQNAPGNFHEQIWAKGLRNPWRFSFDRETGDLYVADVGQGEREEVNVLPKGAAAGANFGWSVYEGTRRRAPVGSPFSEHTPPVAEYTHADGCSVTGGYVYRGESFPELRGIYFLADYCSGKVWGLRQTEGTWRLVELLDTEHNVSSFGEDAEGELYLVDHGGRILRITHSGAAIPPALAG